MSDCYLWIYRILRRTRFDCVAVDADRLAGTSRLHGRIAFGNEQARIIGPHTEGGSARDEIRILEAAGNRRLETGLGSGGLRVHGHRRLARRRDCSGQGEESTYCAVHLSISRTTRK